MTEKPSTQSAIGEHRDKIKSYRRPERLNTDVNIRDEVQGVRDTMDLWKLYKREWIIVFTSNEVGEAGEAEVRRHFDDKYEGRVFPDDVRVHPASELMPGQFSYYLRIYKPNVKGEFKFKDEAYDFASQMGWDGVTVVARNSRDDYALRDYSVKKLTPAQLAAGNA